MKNFVFPLPSAMKQYRAVILWVWAHFGFPEGEPMAYFLAQIDHESNGMTTLTENMNYSATALRNKFGSRITVEEATKYGRIGTVRYPIQKANWEAIANIIYGGAWGKKNLGNTDAGDGWRFRGRGAIMATGRSNYERFHAYCRANKLTIRRGDLFVEIDVVNDPDLMATAEVGLLFAGWFWTNAKINSLITNDLVATCIEIELATRRVNGGKFGLAERRAMTLNYMDPQNEFWT